MKKGILLLLLLILLGACKTQITVDTIVYNARIYTVDSLNAMVEAMAISEGNIVALGNNEEIKANYTSSNKLNLKGQYVYPGFIDAHCHFWGYANTLNTVNLVGTHSFDEVLDRIQEFHKKNNVNFISGRGWDQNDWADKKFPNKSKLDSIFPSIPILIYRIDGHAALVNQAALDYADITSETAVNGGVIKKDEKGNLTGLLIDNAVSLIQVPKNNREVMTSLLLQAEQNCFKYGLTTLSEAGLERYQIEMLDSLQEAELLKMRLYAMVSDNAEDIDYYLDHGKIEKERMHVCSFKFYADGALGSRGACLLHPYSDNSDTHGFLLDSIPHFKENAQKIAAKGWQMNTHAIGDSAGRLMLQIYGQQSRINDLRWRIEHAQLVTPEDRIWFKEYNIIPSVQPTHATSDMYWAEERLGEERMHEAYAYKSLLEQNGKIALGTDFPIEDISTFKTFYAATIRKDAEGFPESGFQVEEALSRMETLKGMTIWAAYANFEEEVKGSLESGKFADFVVLDTDLLNCKPNDILKTRVLYTFINGELVYKK